MLCNLTPHRTGPQTADGRQVSSKKRSPPNESKVCPRQRSGWSELALAADTALGTADDDQETVEMDSVWEARLRSESVGIADSRLVLVDVVASRL